MKTVASHRRGSRRDLQDSLVPDFHSLQSGTDQASLLGIGIRIDEADLLAYIESWESEQR